MGKVDRPIKPKMMADYYKSLSDMFLVSRSYLFHAYAWLKFYNLNEKNNTSLSAAELTRMASALTLSALAVPVVKRYDSISSYTNDEADKKKRMAALLGYSFNPNRETLIDHISSMGLLEHCEPWVQQLFSLLEKEFRPHDLVEVAQRYLERMRGRRRGRVHRVRRWNRRVGDYSVVPAVGKGECLPAAPPPPLPTSPFTRASNALAFPVPL